MEVGSGVKAEKELQLHCSDDQLHDLVKDLLKGRSVQVESSGQDVGLDAAGLLQAIDGVVKKTKHPANVIHSLLPALDLFIKDREVESLAPEITGQLIRFMDLCPGDASVVGHVFHKLALVAQLPPFRTALAFNFVSPETDVLLEDRLNLSKADRPILESLVSSFYSVMQAIPLAVKISIVKTRVFEAIGDLLKEEDSFRFASSSLHQILSLLITAADNQPEVQEIFLARGVHANVADLLARHPTDEAIHQAGSAFFVVLSAVPSNKQLLVRSPVYSALSGTISAFKYKPCVVMPALQAVGNFALAGCDSSAIIDSGIHHSVIHCLADEEVNVICRYQACSVLVNMTYMNLHNRTTLVEAGAHLPVIGLLQNAKSFCTEFISQACKVLINLTAAAVSQCNLVASRLIRDGVHVVLIQLMRDSRETPPCLLWHCCWALTNLNQSEKAKIALIKSGAAHSLVNIISQYRQCEKICGKAMAALNGLTASEKSRTEFVDSGAHTAVICLLKSYPRLPLWIADHLIIVITSLAYRCDSNKRALMVEGAVQPILAYMDEHLCDGQVQVTGCQAIFRISVNGDNKMALIEMGVLQHIRQMMLVHQGNAEVHHQALLTLACLSLIEVDAKRLLGEAGCVQAVAGSLISFPNSVDVQTLGIIVLLRLARNSWNLRQLAKLRLADLVLAMIKMFPQDGDIQNCGSTLLSCLSCRFVERRPGGGRVHCLPSIQSKPNSVRVSQLCGVAEHACPNCKDGKASEMIMTISQLPVSVYQQLIERGWFRRGGVQLFAFTSCHSSSCNTAELRVDLRGFNSSQSSTYRRVLKKCERRGVTVTTLRPQFSDEAFRLYYQYQMRRHEAENCTTCSYRSHLLNNPLVPQEINGIAYGTFHQEYRIDGRLVGVGVIDVLPQALCSVYMFYDLSPDVSRLSLGVYSALMEIQFARSLNTQGADIWHYYLGNFNPINKKLLYKAAYKPTEVRCPHVALPWQPFNETSCSVFADRELVPVLHSQSRSAADKPCPIRKAMACARRVRATKTSALLTYKDMLFWIEGRLVCGSGVLNRYLVHPRCVDRFCLTLDFLIKMVGPDLAKQFEIELEVIEGMKDRA